MRASGYQRVAADWCVAPPWLIEALLEVEPLSGTAYGSGNITRALAQRGFEAWGSDFADRGFGTTGLDFLEANQAAANIVSNPPFDIIEPFIARALVVTTGKVCLLARLALLEGQKRRPLLESTPLARVLVSSRRASMPLGGAGIVAKGGTIPFAWFVWQRGHQGPPIVGWV